MSLFSRKTDEEKREDAEKKEIERQVKEEEKRIIGEKKAEEKRKKEDLKRREKERKEEEKRRKELEKKQKEDDRKRAEQSRKAAREAEKAAEKAGKERKDEDSGRDDASKKGREKKPKGRKMRFGFHFRLPKMKKGRRPAKGGRKEKDAKKKKPGLKLPVRINLIPGPYRNWVENQLYFSGSDTDPVRYIRNMFIISVLIGGGAGVFLSRLAWYAGPAAFLGIFGLMNALLVLSVDRRGRFVDEILPDALLLLSANIRAGYIPSRALILSARKEFGPLSDAIRRAGKEIMTGASLEEGMKEIPKRIKSKDLGRTIKLIIEGIRGGGQIVTLLEENATDIRRRQAIRKEISANIMMYAIFIAFAGCLGAPGLYALSSYLTTTMSKLTPDMSMSDQISSKVSFIQISGANVSPEFLFQFSIAAILITTVFGGMILGLINSGKEKDGLKFAPILALIGLAVFFGASFLVSTMFSSMLPG